MGDGQGARGRGKGGWQKDEKGSDKRLVTDERREAMERMMAEGREKVEIKDG